MIKTKSVFKLTILSAKVQFHDFMGTCVRRKFIFRIAELQFKKRWPCIFCRNVDEKL